MATWYRNGRVTIQNGAKKVIGSNTLWVEGGISKGDVFILNGLVCEISDVLSNDEIMLVDVYSGESVELSSYKIVPRAKQVIAADLALGIEHAVLAYNNLSEKYEEVKGAAAVIKGAGLYIDEDGDLAQDEELGGQDLSGTPEQQAIKSMQQTIKDIKAVTDIVKIAGFYIDEDGDIAQDPEKAAEYYHNISEDQIEDEQVASDEDMDSLLDNIFG